MHIFLIFLLLLAACSACAGDAAPREGDQQRLAFLRGQLMELETLAAPDGVAAADWAQLKSTLAAILLNELEHPSARSVSTPPLTNQSRAPMAFDQLTGTLSWGYYSQGDYDQNGLITISDLTPLGIHLGKSVPADPNSIEAVVDGDSNGLITLAELTALGANFGTSVTEYNIYTSASSADAPVGNGDVSTLSPLATVQLSAAIGQRNTERPRFSFIVENPVPDAFYWVRPSDGETEGTRSSLAGGPPSPPPVARFDLCPQVGPIPFNAELDASQSSDDQGIAEYRWDFDGDGSFDLTTSEPTVTRLYDVEGLYEVTLEVADEQGGASQMKKIIKAGDIEWNYDQPDAPGYGGFFGFSTSIVTGHPTFLLNPNVSGGKFRYNRASDPQGLAWPDPLELDNGLDSTGVGGGLLISDGNPAYFFTLVPGVSSTPGLYFHRASDANGDAWPAATEVTDEFYRAYASITVGGLPAVLFTYGNTNDYGFIIATDAAGTAWEPAVALPELFGGGNGAVAGLCEVEGRPAINYTRDEGGIPTMFFRRAADALGSDWSGPEVLIFGSSTIGTSGGLQIFGGRPAVLAFGQYVRASDTVGSAWGTPMPLPAQFGGLGETSGGLGFFFASNHSLYYSAAPDVDASSWSMPEPVDCVIDFKSFFTRQVMLIDGQPAVFYGSSGFSPVTTFTFYGPLKFARHKP